MGVLLGRALSAGVYSLREEQTEPAATPTEAAEVTPTGLANLPGRSAEEMVGPQPGDLYLAAVQADAEESNLLFATTTALRSRLAADQVRVLEPGSAVLLEGATQRGRSIWKWLAWAALTCLLVEMVFLTRGPRFQEARS